MVETRRAKETIGTAIKKKKKETQKKQTTNNNDEDDKNNMQEAESPSYRIALRNLFSCRHNNSSNSASICNIKDNKQSKVMRQKLPEAAAPPPEPCKRRASVSVCNSSERSSMDKKLLNEISGSSVAKLTASQSSASMGSSSSSSTGGSFRGMHLRRLSGCYECHAVVDPMMRDFPVRATICSCPECGEIFVRAESLELHQITRHAVSELGPDDSSRNIIEIIFQSSWLKKQTPICKVDRILKVHNTQKTITQFEEYRDSIKSKASKLSKKYPRCTADGNELLRFHCTTLICPLGLNRSTNLCDSIPNCAVCSIIRNWFKTDTNGRIQTMATSGRAHDAVQISDERRAMLVCRVIAGRVKRNQDASEEYDSLAGTAGVYSNLDELFVFNPKAILPCFVVIYTA